MVIGQEFLQLSGDDEVQMIEIASLAHEIVNIAESLSRSNVLQNLQDVASTMLSGLARLLHKASSGSPEEILLSPSVMLGQQSPCDRSSLGS